ncbi:MAG: hypothetical protein J6U20_07790 [Fibrobacter sp.]|nr:hypothetical protein [Fibrobacter sp.]
MVTLKRLLLLLVALLLASCANKSMTRYEELAQPLEKKGIDATIEKMKKDQDDLYGSNSEFLYYFDLGCLNHYKRNFKESAANFAKAEQIYEDLYTKSVTNEAAAIVTNDNTRPYRARPFELLLMYEFQILNYLAMMDVDGAMVEVRRSQIAMNALYQKDQKKVNDNGLLRYLSAMVYELDGSPDDAAIAYINTVKAYKEGKIKVPDEVLEFVTEGLVHADRENDLVGLGVQVPGITPKASAIRNEGQEIIVIGYAGHSPILGELYMSGTFISGGVMNLTYKDGETGKLSTFTLVAPPVTGAGTGESFHIGFSLPEIRKLQNRVDHFEVSLDNSRRIRPEMVMAVDEELKQNMEDEKSSTVTRTAVRVILRTIAAQKAKQAMKTDNILLNLLTSIGTDVAQSQIEQADLRVGLFMPHSLFMTRIPVTTGNHKVVVTANGRNGETVELFEFDKLNVAKGQKVFLIVPSIR